MKKTALICIGNELLSGSTVNTNLAFLGQELLKLGLPLHYSVVINDDEKEIAEVLKQCFKEYDIVITTGGLGPTSDDVTKKSVAALLNKKLHFDRKIWDHIVERFSRRGLEVPQINRCQAEIPEGFIPLENKMGTAPGLFYEEDELMLIMLPGVPFEMKWQFSEKVKPLLKKRFNFSPLYKKVLHTLDIPESKLAELTAEIMIPEQVNLAFLSLTGQVDIQVSGEDSATVDNLFASIYERVSHYTWGIDGDTLQGLVKSLMEKRGLTLAVAESCTGGLVQKLLTDLPGASGFYRGGVVAYSNQAKKDLLGVSELCLISSGAVSEETAREMAGGVSRVLKTDIGAAITGIAGPEGGTVDKPVGTVCFAVYYGGKLESATRMFSGDREAIRQRSAMFLLEMIRKRCLKGKRI